jgi:hypothetical protein
MGSTPPPQRFVSDAVALCAAIVRVVFTGANKRHFHLPAKVFQLGISIFYKQCSSGRPAIKLVAAGFHFFKAFARLTDALFL